MKGKMGRSGQGRGEKAIRGEKEEKGWEMKGRDRFKGKGNKGVEKGLRLDL